MVKSVDKHSGGTVEDIASENKELVLVGEQTHTQAHTPTLTFVIRIIIQSIDDRELSYFSDCILCRLASGSNEGAGYTQVTPCTTFIMDPPTIPKQW